ncbi:unnamed protein product [Sphagnum jensenii]|uniref:GH10 domain-containing protein n=1 Tax=Sphagnum jensenii TaxID=128206 RepID=A0ABP0VIF8_9BRYO
MYDLIKELKSQNVPIHGAGLQAHFEVGRVPKDIQQNIQRFAALDLDVAITEVDIRIKMPADAAKLNNRRRTTEMLSKHVWQYRDVWGSAFLAH